MRTICIVSILAVALASAGLAASIDGKWYSEQTVERNGQTFKIARTFEFQTEGEKLTGTVTLAFGDMEPRKIEIKDGKFAGNKFSFTITLPTPNGEFNLQYEGTLEGNTIKGTSSGGRGPSRPFEAKRQ
jgi:hypothetical protein